MFVVVVEQQPPLAAVDCFALRCKLICAYVSSCTLLFILAGSDFSFSTHSQTSSLNASLVFFLWSGSRRYFCWSAAHEYSTPSPASSGWDFGVKSTEIPIAFARTCRWVFSSRKSLHCDSKYARDVDLSKVPSGSFLPCTHYNFRQQSALALYIPATLLLSCGHLAHRLGRRNTFVFGYYLELLPAMSPRGIVMPSCSRSWSISCLVCGFICVSVVDRSSHCTKRWSGVERAHFMYALGVRHQVKRLNNKHLAILYFDLKRIYYPYVTRLTTTANMPQISRSGIHSVLLRQQWHGTPSLGNLLKPSQDKPVAALNAHLECLDSRTLWKLHNEFFSDFACETMSTYIQITMKFLTSN